MKELKGNYGTKDYGVLKKEKRKKRKRRTGKRSKGNIFIYLFFLAIILLGIINAVRVYSSVAGGKSTGETESSIYSEESDKGLSFEKKYKKGRRRNNQSDKNTGNNTDDVENTGEAVPEDGDWRLTLVNKWHPISKDYSINLTYLSRGHAVDERCYPYLQQMMDDCRSAGLFPLICSSYRTWEKQESLYYNQVNELISQGYSREEAKEEAKTSNAVPGTSEHQLGLAVDIVDRDYQLLDERQETTGVQKWLMENCWKYGFILRYPNGKSNITGIIYEPWHYRFVGVEAAEEIHKQGVCLEEYLGETKDSD